MNRLACSWDPSSAWGRECIEVCTIRAAWTCNANFSSIIWYINIYYMSWQWWPKASIHGSWIHGYHSKVPCVAKCLSVHGGTQLMYLQNFTNFIYHIYRCFTCFTCFTSFHFSLSSWQVWSNEHVPSRRRPWPRPAFSILRPTYLCCDSFIAGRAVESVE